MKKSLTFLFLAIVLFTVASPASAQATSGPSDKAWSFICAAFALGFAAAICGLAQAKAAAAACEGMARNPGAANDIRLALLLGLALIESLVLYVLVIAFVILFK